MSDPHIDTVVDYLSSLLKQGQRHFVLLPWAANATLAQPLRSFLDSISIAPQDCLIISDEQSLDGAIKHYPASAAVDLLGGEYPYIFYDIRAAINANVLCALAGMVRGGGCLFLVSNADETANQPFSQRCLRIIKAAHAPSFSITQLKQYQNVSQNNKLHALAPAAPSFELTPHQHQVIAAITHITAGQRRKPVLLSADRGRGKSTVLGYAAADLVKQGKQILITAINRRAVIQLEQAFKRCHPDYQGELPFMASEKLLKLKPKVDVLLIDEAAQLGLVVLQQLLKHYPRLALATTSNGYEGSGQGFRLKFLPLLQKHSRGIIEHRLDQPLRWQADDWLEQTTNQIGLLNADVTPLPVQASCPDIPEQARHIKPQAKPRAGPSSKLAIAKLDITKLHVSCIDGATLAQDERLLKAYYALLSLAHYQTRPQDLQQLLNQQAMRHYLAFDEDQRLLAGMSVLHEPLADAQLQQQLLSGERRLAGYLSGQLAALNSGCATWLQVEYLRVVRIVVHPQRQRLGLGSYLLDSLKPTARQVISTSFSADAEVTQFWQNNNFVTVHIGQKRNPGTARVGLLMIKDSHGLIALSQTTEQFLQRLGSELWLHRLELDAATLYQVLKSRRASIPQAIVSPALKRFCLQHAPLSSVIHDLAWQIFCHLAHSDHHDNTLIANWHGYLSNLLNQPNDIDKKAMRQQLAELIKLS